MNQRQGRADPETDRQTQNHLTKRPEDGNPSTAADVAPKHHHQNQTVQQSLRAGPALAVNRNGYKPASSAPISAQQKTDWIKEVPNLDSFIGLCDSEPAFRLLAITDDRFLNEIVENLYKYDGKALIATAFGMTDTLTGHEDICDKFLAALDQKRALDPEFTKTLARAFKQAEMNPEGSARFAQRVFDRVQKWSEESIGPADENQSLMNHAKMYAFAASGDSKGLIDHFQSSWERRVNLDVCKSFFALGNPLTIAAVNKKFEFIADVAGPVLGMMMKETQGLAGNAMVLKFKSFNKKLENSRRCMLCVANTSEEMSRVFDCLQKVPIDRRKTIMRLIETEKANIKHLPQLLELFIRKDLRLRPADAPLPLDSDLPELDSNPMSPEAEPQRLAVPRPSTDEMLHFEHFWLSIITWMCGTEAFRPPQDRPMLGALIDMGFVAVVDERFRMCRLEPIPEWE